MPLGSVLKSFRDRGYGSGENSGEPEDSKGPRLITLTDDEAKGLAEYKKEGGDEIVCQVTGRLDGNEFSVISVTAPGGEEKMPGNEDEMAAKVMGMMGKPPMMQNQTMPSPG